MQHQKSIDSLVEIKSGLALRGRLEEEPGADCSVIQMRDVDYMNFTIDIPKPQLNSQGLSANLLLQSGDVLLLAKGNNNVAVVFKSNIKATVTNVFYILRPRDPCIEPEYLALVLNRGPASRELNKAKEGTAITNINASSLANVIISYPSIAKQKMIVSLYRMWQTEKQQTLELLNMKERYFNQILLSQLPDSPLPDPFTDDTRLWVGYELSGLYHKAKIEFKELVVIKGLDHPVREGVFIIISMEQHSRTVSTSPTATRSYQAVKEWELILPRDLRTHNDPEIPEDVKSKEIMNTIPHSLIQSITMVDRFGNHVEPINPWN